MSEEYILRMEQICKYFPGTKALDHVDFHIRRGEVHALIGENGAGKSTLIKVLTGVYRKDAGKIEFDGKALEPTNALEVQQAGISTIYQEISLVPQLSVAENIFIGREIKCRGMIDWKAIRERSRRLLSELGLDIDVTRLLEDYGTAIQQMVAIARAISINAKLVIMDEATSSLDDDEVKVLFGIIRKLQEKGIAVLFISHRLKEIFEISDMITVLKDGCLVGEYRTSELTRMELVSKMIGRAAEDIVDTHREYRTVTGDTYLKADGIRSGVRLNGLNLTVKKGEIVGLAGLLGAGRTELARVIFGVDKKDEGEIEINGTPVHFKIPKDAIRRSLAFCSENRKVEGIIPHLSVSDNISMANMGKISRFGVISGKKQDAVAREFIEKIRIKVSSPEQEIVSLSGGNQQKVILGRWLNTNPDFVILDEPTRGIDVGAKKEIEGLIHQMAAQGISILMISSEFEELVRNCDRVEVIRDGRNTGTLVGEEITEEHIMHAIAEGNGGDDYEG